MKPIYALIAVALLSSNAIAQSNNSSSPAGVWEHKSQDANCEMKLDFTHSGYITRAAGSLTYTTSATMTADGAGWILDEKLTSDNGQKGCDGQPADKVLQHLTQSKAYIEVQGDTLRYYRSKGDRKSLAFARLAP